METEEILLLGGIGLAAFLMYGAVKGAADVLGPGGGGVPDGAGGGWLANVASSVSDAAAGAITAATGGASAIVTAPQTFNCGDAYMSAQVPLGAGSWAYPDDYVLPCAGGLTVGSLRAANLSSSDIMQTITSAECGCAAAKQKKLPIKNNLIQTPAQSGTSGLAAVPYGKHHRYYVREAPGWPADQFPRGHQLWRG